MTLAVQCTARVKVSGCAILIVTHDFRRILVQLIAVGALHHGASAFHVCTSLQVIMDTATNVCAFDGILHELQDVARWRLKRVAPSNGLATCIPVEICACEIPAMNIMTIIPLTSVKEATGALERATPAFLCTTLRVVALRTIRILALELVSIVSVEVHGRATVCQTITLWDAALLIVFK